MLEPGTFFQVADREFNDRVVAVERVRGDGVVLGVRDERVVSPVGKQLGLAAGETGAAHDQPDGASASPGPGAVVGLGDLGSAAEGIVDIGPISLGDRRDSGADRLVLADGDRPQHMMAVERVDEFPGPESRLSRFLCEGVSLGNLGFVLGRRL